MNSLLRSQRSFRLLSKASILNAIPQPMMSP
jgi:hypothetical protein